MRLLIAIVLGAAAWLPGLSHAAATPPRCKASSIFAIVVHGGVLSKPIPEMDRLIVMRHTLGQARSALSAGASALDAVEAAVREMEDSGKFNAGRGAIRNTAGVVETDASIMDGRDMRAGAVASMLALKNPVSAARLVMDKSPHVLMVGDRGEVYVRDLGAQSVDPSYFLNNQPPKPGESHGTVGATALDRCGDIAAATSTGGYDVKAPGRVGDTPIVGAGVYAQNGLGGFSATGHGELFIRYSIAKDVADRMAYAHQTMEAAMRADINEKLGPMKEIGALIGVAPDGHVAMAWAGAGLFRGYATDEENPVVAVYDGTTGSRPRKLGH